MKIKITPTKLFYQIVVLICLAVSKIAFSQGTWSSLPNFPAPGRQAATSFSIGNSVYYATGWNPSSGPLNDMWAYNTATNTWVQKAPVPGAARFLASSFAINGYGYLGAGKKNPQFFVQFPSADVDFYKYDPATNTWYTMAPIPHPQASSGVFGATGLTSGGLGYLFGGGTDYGGNASYPYVGSSAKIFYQYNPATNTWTTLNYGLQYGIICASGFAINNSIYIAGGFIPGYEAGNSGYAEIGSQATYQYNVSSGTWTRKSNIPNPVYSAASFVSLDRGYVIGGAVSATGVYDAWQASSNLISKYNPYSDSWATLTSTSPDYLMLGASSTNCDKAYIATGNYRSSGMSQAHYSFVPVIDQNYISGPGAVCNSFDSNFNLQLSEPGTVTWTTSSNLYTTSGQGTSSANIRANTSTPGLGWVQASFSNSGCTVFTFTTNVYVGLPGIVGSLNKNVNNPPFCVGATLGVSINPVTGANSYNWFSNNTSIMDASGSGTSGVLDANAAGSCTFSIVAIGTCGNSQANYHVIVQDCSGGGGGALALAVSPNPTASILTVQVTDSLSTNPESNTLDQHYEINIMDRFSRKVFSAQSNEKVFEIPVNNLPPDIYYLNLIYKDALVQKQIVIKR